MYMYMYHIFFPLEQNDEKVKDIISKSKGHPRQRLQHIYDLAKLKAVCEGGDTMDTKFDLTAEQGDLKVVRAHSSSYLSLSAVPVLFLCLHTSLSPPLHSGPQWVWPLPAQVPQELSGADGRVEQGQ